jgi:hypothetical protein
MNDDTDILQSSNTDDFLLSRVVPIAPHGHEDERRRGTTPMMPDGVSTQVQ